ncbi:MAG: S8 family serine peptidase [Dehalococcoidia bacterium]
MPAVYLVHHPDDAAFVRESLLPPLAPLGFDRSIAEVPSAVEHTATVLVVVSVRAAESADFLGAAEAALRSRTPMVVVHRTPFGEAAGVLTDLRRAATIDPVVAAQPSEMWRRLARLLQPDAALKGELNGVGQPIDWSPGAFSVLLADAARRSDFAFGAELIAAFGAHVARRDGAYPAEYSQRDLKTLRDMRQFVLMRDYAAAAIAWGSKDHTVRRQYGQALIELKQFDEAIEILQKVVEGAPADGTREERREHYEARGLVGRAYKQRYVDAGERADGRWLTTAIETYWSAYREEHDNTWHGINAASCLLRAARDGVEIPQADPPAKIAREILAILDDRAGEDERLEIWDVATRVEAYIDLGDLESAAACLREYLTHPDMRPFEATSTYRQFDEVLQLRQSEEGRPLLGDLVECVVRLRAGGRIGMAHAEDKRFLLRVADPHWKPAGVPDLVLGTRRGSVVTIRGSARAIEELLKDPLVISIEESHPAGPPDSEQPAAATDAERSLRFLGVAETYEGVDGPFCEKGSLALVAVIDNGIDVLHKAFRNADGTSCIVAVWDQTEKIDNPAPGVPFGRLHTAEDIAGYLAHDSVPEQLARGSWHGTHVASIAVGRPCGEFAGGVAPEARLLVVVSNETGPIGYSAAFGAALDFIDAKATELAVPVVVNVSQGMNAGAHDGLSSLEIDFDEFSHSGRKPGRVVVKSAGNERDKRGHAKLTVPPGGVDELTLRCPPGPSRKVNLELWWDQRNTYRFQLRSPDGDHSNWVDRMQPVVDDNFARQGDYTIELVPSHVDNDDSMLRVQFTCRYARHADPDAEWGLAVEADKVQVAGDIHSWVERDSFPPTRFATHESEEMTLSVPGTARSVITVGAVGATCPVRIGSFSSFGPTRKGREERPDLCAPGVEVTAAKRGTRGGVCTEDGTSMAAPHVTGAVALVLSRAVGRSPRWPNASQVRGLLRRNTKFGNLYWDRGQGYGVLDIKKLLEDGLPTLI